MIAFRKDYNNDDNESDLIKKLKSLLEEIDLEVDSESDLLHLNFSELLDFIYYNLFVENKTSITINISKNQYNELFIKELDKHG